MEGQGAAHVPLEAAGVPEGGGVLVRLERGGAHGAAVRGVVHEVGDLPVVVLVLDDVRPRRARVLGREQPHPVRQRVAQPHLRRRIEVQLPGDDEHAVAVERGAQLRREGGAGRAGPVGAADVHAARLHAER